MSNAIKKINGLILDYSECGDGSGMAESVILEENIEKFEELLKELNYGWIGYDELDDNKVKMIHEEF